MQNKILKSLGFTAVTCHNIYDFGLFVTICCKHQIALTGNLNKQYEECQNLKMTIERLNENFIHPSKKAEEKK